MNRIIDGIRQMFPDANPDDVVAMLNKADAVKLHRLVIPKD